MSADALDPRSDLQHLMAALVVMVAGPCTTDPQRFMASDGLTPAGVTLVADARAALAAITLLASFFGCAMLPTAARSMPGVEGMEPVAAELLRRVLLEE